MIVPDISWKEHGVLITYQDSKLSYSYSSLPDSDLIIPGVDLDEFNQMMESIRYNPKEIFVKNFLNRNDDPPGYQRCRALNLARIYPNHFNIVSQSFCTLAYRYIHDNMGSINELENMYKKLQGFKEFNNPHSSKIAYRWTTSIWTAMAHCYVKEGNANAALKLFNKIHSYADITFWPFAIVNIIGACHVTGQSVEYSKKIYETAIHMYDIQNVHNLSEIIQASRILEVIMGSNGVGAKEINGLYVKAKDLLKNSI